MMFKPKPQNRFYTSRSSLELDISELVGLEDRVKAAISNGTTARDISNQIKPAHILWLYGAPMGVAVLMKHTPVGEDFSNWGYWDYGSYILYGGDHAKGTLRRGWITTDPSEAENNKVLPIDFAHIRWHVARNVKVHRKNNTTYWCDLVNCVPYGCAVEYGHWVVYPGERNKWTSSHAGGAKPHPLNYLTPKRSSVSGRWVEGQYFVRDATSEANWKPVVKTMHDEYVRRFRKVFK